METVVDPTDFSQADVNLRLENEEKIQILRDMMRIRQFEQTAQKFYVSKQKMGGFLHLYSGQESVAVGTTSLLGSDDHVITAYRDHGHALSLGMSMNECMAELFGKVTGCSKGKGGSMHFFAPDKNFWGGHGIVAGQTPLGAGLAYGLKYKGIRGCCLCFLGDGAVNQGSYHESLNLASLFDLPVIYIIENNGYSMGTSQERSSAYKNCLAERGDGYNIIWDLVNGEDVYELRAKTKIAIDRAHNESRPTVLEVATYRYFGHSVADANAKKYRTAEEIDQYKKYHDPIFLWQSRLIEEGLLTEEEAKGMQKEARQEAVASAEYADQSPFPEPHEILEDVYYEVDRQTESGRTGRHFFNND
ncbi:MAG: thiamine pyrophosphate-dependent enzyme [Verrucomicrobiota bacterium]